MTEKKKPATKAKAAPKKAPAKKTGTKTTGAAKVAKTEAKAAPSTEPAETLKVQKPKVPEYLSKKASEFIVGTPGYKEVVADYNKIYKRQYNVNRVPPFIFKNMLVHLGRHYRNAK